MHGIKNNDVSIFLYDFVNLCPISDATQSEKNTSKRAV